MFLLGAEALRAQQLFFENLNKQLEQPSLEAYKIFQDHKGYLWFSTELGFYKFDGKTTKKIDLQNTVPNETVYFIWENSKKELSIITSKNRVLFLKKDRVVAYSFTKKFSELLQKEVKQNNTVYHCSEDHHGNYIFNSNYFSYVINEKTKAIKKIGVNNKNLIFSIFLKKNKSYFLRSNKLDFKFPNQITKIYFETEAEKEALVIPSSEVSNPYNYSQIIHVDKTTFFSFGEILFIKTEGKPIRMLKMANVILDIKIDTQKGLWVGVYKNGVHHFKQYMDLDHPTVSLDQLSVSNITFDHEENVWCTTLEKGIFICRNPSVKSFHQGVFQNNSIMLLKKIGDKIYYSDAIGQLHSIQKNLGIQKEIFIPSYAEFTDMIEVNGTYYISSKNYVVKTNDFKTLTYLSNLCTYAMTTVGERLFFLSIDEILEIKGNKVLSFFKDSKNKGTTMVGLPNDQLLVGTKTGLYSIHTKNKAITKWPKFNYPVTKLFLQKDKIWIGTKGYGLWLIQKNAFVKLPFSDELPSSYVTDICEDENEKIWVATTKGIYKIDLDKKQSLASRLSIENGLPDNYCNKITAANDHIYAATSQSLFIFPREMKCKNTNPLKFYLNSIAINSKKINPNTKTLVLEHHENNIELQFDVLSFKNKTYKIKYQLSPFNFAPKLINSNKLVFENLDPGDYTFDALVFNNDGIASENKIQLQFTIKKPFWKTKLFIGISLLGIMGLLYFIIRFIIIRVKKKEAAKTELNKLIAESQLMALQSQMNPHFIFNAINSIQNFILKNEKEAAYNYLAKFSTLIRKVLNNSQQSTVSLREELETVKLYIALEQLRFKNKFEFTLEVLLDLEMEEYYIPSMLIQPYVENSIWHGLMNLEDRIGKLEIVVYKEASLLMIAITDNGIGRKKSEEYKSGRMHKPIATSLNQKRIEVMQHYTHTEGIKIKTEDLYDSAGNGTGTRVIISLPVHLY